MWFEVTIYLHNSYLNSVIIRRKRSTKSKLFTLRTSRIQKSFCDSRLIDNFKYYLIPIITFSLDDYNGLIIL